MKNQKLLMTIMVLAQIIPAKSFSDPRAASQKQKNEQTSTAETDREDTVRTIELAHNDATFNKKAAINRVGLFPEKVQKGDLVYARFVAQRNPYTLTRFAQRINEQHHFAPNTNRYRTNAYRQATVVRTWKDDDTFLKAMKEQRKSDAEILKEFEKRGLSPLKPLEVQIAVPGRAYESVYHLTELGLTDNIMSENFINGEVVLFPTTRNGKRVYAEGIVEATLGDGDLIVRHGLESNRVLAEDLFTTEKSIENHDYRIGEEVLYRFETEGTPARDIKSRVNYVNGLLLVEFTQGGKVVHNKLEKHTYNQAVELKTTAPQISMEFARVMGISPITGDVIIHLRKTNELIRIKKSRLDSTEGLPAQIIKAINSCKILFF